MALSVGMWSVSINSTDDNGGNYPMEGEMELHDFGRVTGIVYEVGRDDAMIVPTGKWSPDSGLMFEMRYEHSANGYKFHAKGGGGLRAQLGKNISRKVLGKSRSTKSMSYNVNQPSSPSSVTRGGWGLEDDVLKSFRCRRTLEGQWQLGEWPSDILCQPAQERGDFEIVLEGPKKMPARKDCVVHVVTGDARAAGTDCGVVVQIVGQGATTLPLALDSSNRCPTADKSDHASKPLQRCQSDAYTVRVDTSIGAFQGLVVWVDSADPYDTRQGLFLNRIEVEDTASDLWTVFPCNAWLDCSEGGGITCRHLTARSVGTESGEKLLKQQLGNEMREHCTANKALQESVEELEARLCESQEALGRAEAVLDTAVPSKSPDARQECVIERLKSVLEEHESEISELKKELHEATSSCNTYKGKFSAAQDEIKEMQQQIAQLTEQRDSARAQHTAMKTLAETTATEAERKSKQWKSEKEHLEMEIVAKVNETALRLTKDSEACVAELKMQHSTQMAETVSKLKTAVHAGRLAVSAHDASKKRWQSKHDATNALLEKIQDEFKALKQEYEELNEEHKQVVETMELRLSAAEILSWQERVDDVVKNVHSANTPPSARKSRVSASLSIHTPRRGVSRPQSAPSPQSTSSSSCRSSFSTQTQEVKNAYKDGYSGLGFRVVAPNERLKAQKMSREYVYR
mmetsp:Transcript_28069/g.53117  ORF Transcript_28069/g.53117 Transcript_28069/m.53117 type:complete len:688 (+) Transcript_28069:162-2225(+)|eukprot:CAMPEP_0114228854 /NCGR_PEP_ID=MMETSP0058-20121206/2583_1 /TAXON_ID=36894 /ORGANISM="Pyramimonas parkeae, CCMP726" /LENGTH=687 /DNA_ID=CAMNT_0001339865 /DNA_START=149 /DNA_END=2212 /DNA_ORIENTATION=+